MLGRALFLPLYLVNRSALVDDRESLLLHFLVPISLWIIIVLCLFDYFLYALGCNVLQEILLPLRCLVAKLTFVDEADVVLGTVL